MASCSASETDSEKHFGRKDCFAGDDAAARWGIGFFFPVLTRLTSPFNNVQSMHFEGGGSDERTLSSASAGPLPPSTHATRDVSPAALLAATLAAAALVPPPRLAGVFRDRP